MPLVSQGARAAKISRVKIGTRLTLVLLGCLTPLLAVYVYLSVRVSSRIYDEDLRRQTRATERALGAALRVDVNGGNWADIREEIQAMAAQRIFAALLDSSGRVRFSLPSFPLGLAQADQVKADLAEGGISEFSYSTGERHWLCRIVPLEGTKPLLYLLVAQDWTEEREDLEGRLLRSLANAAALMALIAVLIPLISRRYVTRPLAELSRRVASISGNESNGAAPTGDEVRLISGEFLRLDRELVAAHTRLVEENERKLELERRLRRSDKLATIGTLSSGLAHEIGTPLGVIRGRAEHLLSSRPDGRRVAEGLEIIISQIDRITRIIRLLLDFARQREPVRSACDVRSIISRTMHLLETEAERRNVRIVTELDDSPLMVQCDPDQLQQVFVNLGVNAFDAMEEQGSGTLYVTAKRMVNGVENRICLRFSDTGHGVSRELASSLFDPFFTTKEPGKGTGMGLAVSQSIVRDHEGELTLEDASKGACFVLTLPAAAQSQMRMLGGGMT